MRFATFSLELAANSYCLSCRETERDWDKDLADDVKGEVEAKYGRVDFIKVEKESQVCSYPTSQVWCNSSLAGRDLRQI